MPFLGDIARFKISPKTTEYQPSIRHEVLKWMQQHPEDCQKTTYAELANTIIIPNSGISTKSIKTAIAGMAHHNMIGYHGRQHSKKKNIYIKGRCKTMFLGASGQNIYPEEIEDKLNNQTAVGESLIVEREGKLVALVFPDETLTKRMTFEEIQKIMRANLEKLNTLIPSYSKVSNIEVQEQPFEKTPKKSIKRFLYK